MKDMKTSSSCALLVLVLSVGLPAQTLLDQVVVKFGGEVVTQLDVRQARLLKLVSAPCETDQAYLDALVDRRLMLGDLRRLPMPEPSAAAIEDRRRDWLRSLGSPAPDELTRRLREAGLTETALAAWLRDDVRIQSYIAERFAGHTGDLANWLDVLRQRAGIVK